MCAPCRCRSRSFLPSLATPVAPVMKVIMGALLAELCQRGEVKGVSSHVIAQWLEALGDRTVGITTPPPQSRGQPPPSCSCSPPPPSFGLERLAVASTRRYAGTHETGRAALLTARFGFIRHAASTAARQLGTGRQGVVIWTGESERRVASARLQVASTETDGKLAGCVRECLN